MSVFKHFWQNLIQRFKPRVHSPAEESRQELSTARLEQQNLLGQLNDLRAEVKQELSDAGLEWQTLSGELSGLHSEVGRDLSVTREELQGLHGQLTGLQAEVERGLSAASQDQQNLLGLLNGLRAEVKQDLSDAGLERQSLGGEVAGLRSEVEHGLSVAREELQGLHGQLTGLQSEIEHGLSAVREEQNVLLGRLTGLQSDYERELSVARQEKQSLLGQLSGLQNDLERIRHQDEQLRAELQQHFEQLQSERDAANQEVMALRASLADANVRQEATDTRVGSLEIGLKEQQQEHDAALQRALVRERRQARRLTAALTVASAAFVLGIVGSAINFWEVHNTTRLLAEVSQGIRDIRYTLEGKPGGNVQAPVEVLPTVPAGKRETPPAATSSGALPEPSKKVEMTQGLSSTELPEPNFVATKSLPLEGHTFKSRQDLHAFFEENALQPGVISTPDGLQYRELIAGTGKTPGSHDKVVIEYRAFRPDGTELDNSFKEVLPSSFTVDDAIPALKEALPRMQEGAQWELYIPPRLTYTGVRKRGPRGFEPLILTVELISVTTAEKGKDH